MELKSRVPVIVRMRIPYFVKCSICGIEENGHDVEEL